MKFTLPSLLAVAVLTGLMYHPRPAYGQSKEIGALQRDIYDLSRKLDELKSGQGERSAQMETLLKQVMEANAKLAADTQALQETVRRNQTEQQTRVFEPMAAVKQGMEDVSGNVSAVQASLTTMRTRQEKMESMLSDLSAAVRLLATQTPAAAPQSSTSPTGPSSADAASLLFSAAQRDKLAGKLDFALSEFLDISQKYPESPEAPMAVFEMGSLYARNEQYEDAVKAYDRVLEQFGDNPMRKDAQFLKAEQLANMGRRAEAVREFNSFARQYPGDQNTARAIERVRELQTPAAAKGKQASKQTTKGKSK